MIDFTQVIKDRLAEERRAEDGLLHPSSDLLGSLRHSQLRLAGAPTIVSQLVSDVRMQTGTLWHEFVGDALQKSGATVMREVNLGKWMPEGWDGTADFLEFDGLEGACTLVDLKTTKGESLRYIKQDGAKEEHIWQVSAYWWACYEKGMPMIDAAMIYYLPMNDTSDKDEFIEPMEAWINPLPQDMVWGRMEERWAKTKAYLDSRNFQSIHNWNDRPWITDELEPVQPRVQKLSWSKDHWDVKLVPHWSAQFCPYDNELCDCSEQGTTKIGEWHWASGMDNQLIAVYYSRPNYEFIEPDVKPTEKEIAKRGKSD